MNQFIDDVMDELSNNHNTDFSVDFLAHNINKIGDLKWLTVEFTFKFKKSYKIMKTNYYISCDIGINKIENSCSKSDCWGDTIFTSHSLGIPTKENIVEKVLEMMKILKSAKFDKLTGTFEYGNEKKFTVPELSSAEDCIICYDKTETITDCRHHICVPCWQNLTKMNCPLCRKENIKIKCNCC